MKFEPYDYQKTAINYVKNNKKCGLFLDMGLGKALDDNTILPTPSGLKKVKDIKLGDQLFGKNGKPTNVIGVYKHKNKTAYKVTLSDTRSFICCDEHLIPFLSQNSEKIQSKPLKEIITDRKNGKVYQIPTCEAVEYAEKNHPIKPYDIGILHGVKNGIPEEYIFDSIENRTELLKGIADSSKKKINLTTTEIQQIQRIMWSLGKHCSYKKLFETDFQNIKSDKITITDIEPMSKRDMTCFEVDAEDKLFLINDYIVTHNTAITLHALKDLGQSGQLKNGHILVIAPKNIARNTWPDEMDNWDGFSGVQRISLIEKPNGVALTKKKREELFAQIPTERPSIYFINREQLLNLIAYGKTHFKNQWYFPTVIIDELQSFKSSASKRFKEFKKIIPQVDRLIGLTGTPAPNGLMDLWSEIYLLDQGARLGKTMSEYRNRWFFGGRRTAEGIIYEWIPMPGAEDSIYEAISDITMSMKNDENFPEVTYNEIRHKMTAADTKLYKKFQREKILNLDPDIEITADSAAVLAGKLTQIASGSLYKETGSHEYEEIHSMKLDMLSDVIDQAQGSPVLCFYWFQSDKERIMKAFPYAVHFEGKREQTQAWNNGDYKLMIAQPASAGHGLNLQKGPGHTICWYTLPWSLELYLQGNKRIHRPGQQHPVIIHHLINKGTIDEKILKALTEKEDFQNRLMDAVKAEIDEI